MDGTGHELLARARLSLEEDHEVGIGHLPDLLGDILNPATWSHEPSKRALLAELIRGPFVLRSSCARSNASPQGDQDLVGLKRFAEVVVGAELHGLDSRGGLPVPGQD